MGRPCPRGCGGQLVARETKSCAACRAADKVRPCLYCGVQLQGNRSKCCGASECKKAHARVRKIADNDRARERYATDSEYRQRRLAGVKQYRAANPERARQWDRTYYEKHREAVIADKSFRERARRARYKNTMVLPFTPEQLQARLSVYDRCWICGSESWDEVDHVKPIDKGGPHILANLRPACRPCNRRKSATWPIDTTSRKAQTHADLR